MRKSKIQRTLTPSLAALVLAGACMAPLAKASEVRFSSLPGNNTSFLTPEEYLAHWNALEAANPTPPAGFGNAPVGTWDHPVPGNVHNAGLIPGGATQNLAYHYRVVLDVGAGDAGAFDFRIAPDFGFGGAAFLNGAPVAHNPNDMWWGTGWGDSNQLFLFGAMLAAGSHVIDVYGQEGCCDGPTAGQFSRDGGQTWTAFGLGDGLDRVTRVPEGGTTALLLGTGLGALMAVRRARRVS